jgi:hypothetical protein
MPLIDPPSSYIVSAARGDETQELITRNDATTCPTTAAIRVGPT